MQKKQVARNKHKCVPERRDLQAHQAQAIVEPVPKSSHLNVVPGENTSVGAETDRRSPTGSKRGSAATWHLATAGTPFGLLRKVYASAPRFAESSNRSPFHNGSNSFRIGRQRAPSISF